ncbi:hypothetical protein YPPY36_1784, partial [Yersinia pestis PY-36]
MTCREPFP